MATLITLPPKVPYWKQRSVDKYAAEKVCAVCKLPKPMSEFAKHPSCSDGRTNTCKGCAKRKKKQREDKFVF